MLETIIWIIAAPFILYEMVQLIKVFAKAGRQGKIRTRERQHVLERQLRTIEKVDNEIGNLTQSLKCPSCGASITIDPKHVSTFCSFCGAPLPKAEELIKLSFEYMDKTAQRNAELEKLHIMTEDQKHKRRSDNLPLIVTFSFIGFFLLVTLIIFR